MTKTYGSSTIDIMKDFDQCITVLLSLLLVSKGMTCFVKSQLSGAETLKCLLIIKPMTSLSRSMSFFSVI